jgi:hypothetical protein
MEAVEIKAARIEETGNLPPVEAQKRYTKTAIAVAVLGAAILAIGVLACTPVIIVIPAAAAAAMVATGGMGLLGGGIWASLECIKQTGTPDSSGSVQKDPTEESPTSTPHSSRRGSLKIDPATSPRTSKTMTVNRPQTDAPKGNGSASSLSTTTVNLSAVAVTTDTDEACQSPFPTISSFLADSDQNPEEAQEAALIGKPDGNGSAPPLVVAAEPLDSVPPVVTQRVVVGNLSPSYSVKFESEESASIETSPASSVTGTVLRLNNGAISQKDIKLQSLQHVLFAGYPNMPFLRHHSVALFSQRVVERSLETVQQDAEPSSSLSATLAQNSSERRTTSKAASAVKAFLRLIPAKMRGKILEQAAKSKP